MSSAILYVAIVAIWACVLIPRWLRRDAARATVYAAGVPEAVPVGATDGEGLAVDADGNGRGASANGEPASREPDHREPDHREPDDAGDAHRPAHPPMTAEESRRRMLAARRRLLIMLLVLEAAAIALAVLGLAAMWVVAPPTVMLAGYVLLLREAAHADAEQAQREATAAARARERARRQARAERRIAPAAATAPSAATTAAALAARFAAAPVPADYEDAGPGRDFAPGLAGKYTPSYADPDTVDEDYDTYTPPRLRAVGD